MTSTPENNTQCLELREIAHPQFILPEITVPPAHEQRKVPVVGTKREQAQEAPHTQLIKRTFQSQNAVIFFATIIWGRGVSVPNASFGIVAFVVALVNAINTQNTPFDVLHGAIPPQR
jgi:hypothetical protein